VLEATLRPQGRAAVPLSLALGETETVLVISGPNTGGKTVALKTIGLAALSAQSGIPVAAQQAEMPVFDRVLVDIGDEQSIAADLSTFSAHMLNLKSMLALATESSLVLVDEMGTGTAPEEGAALAVALLEEFRERRALTLATTHHDRVDDSRNSQCGDGV
jgi:DNA mismatch repair protein MutS2